MRVIFHAYFIKEGIYMAYPVNAIADYVINYAKNAGNYVNNLKLQKILYYLEARFLAEEGKSLFTEDIEKWQYGPVVPTVYYRFNHLGAEDITHVPADFDFMSLLDDDFRKTPESHQDSDNELFSAYEKEVIDMTIDKLLKFKPFDLVDETHRHESWGKDEERILGGDRNIKYEREEIKRDFTNQPEFKLWLN